MNARRTGASCANSKWRSPWIWPASGGTDMRSLQTQAEWCARAQWVLGVTLGVIVVGFYLMVYRPNTQKLDGLEMQIAAKRRDLNSNRTRVQILPDVVIAVNEMRNRLDRFDKKL